MPGKPARSAGLAWAGDGRIAGPDDVRRILADVNTAGLRRDNTALATQLVQSADEAALTEPDIGRVLPAYPAIAQLLPWPGGIRRGATVAVVGSTSLLMALLAGALSQGSWGACVGMPDFGALAAAEIGVPLERLALVPAPGPDWPTVVSALIDGVDVVAVAAPPGSESATRALMNRAQAERLRAAGDDLMAKLRPDHRADRPKMDRSRRRPRPPPAPGNDVAGRGQGPGRAPPHRHRDHARSLCGIAVDATLHHAPGVE